MFFTNKPENDLFVASELENLIGSHGLGDGFVSDEKIHSFITGFISASKRMGEFASSHESFTKEMDFGYFFRIVQSLINLNPEFTHKACRHLFTKNGLFKDKVKLAEFSKKVQSFYELHFLLNIFKEINNVLMHSVKNKEKMAYIPAINSLLFDLIEFIEFVVKSNPDFEKYYKAEKIKIFESADHNPVTVAKTNIENKIAFYRDLDYSTVFNQALLMFINVYVAYYDQGDKQGFQAINQFCAWYLVERTKYKDQYQVLFNYVVAVTLVDIFLNVGRIMIATRQMIDTHTSVTLDLKSFYFITKDSLFKKKQESSIHKSLRLEMNVNTNPLTQTLRDKYGIFSITSNLKNNTRDFSYQTLYFNQDGEVDLKKFNPRNLFEVYAFLEHYAFDVWDVVAEDKQLIPKEAFELIYSLNKNISERGFNRWYIHTFYKVFVMDAKILSESFVSHLDKVIGGINKECIDSLISNYCVCEMLWYIKYKHAYLLESVVAYVDRLEREGLYYAKQDEVKGLYGYLIHLESSLDNIISMQDDSEAKRWLSSFIPERIASLLDFENEMEMQDWRNDVIEFWEKRIEFIYDTKIYSQIYNIVRKTNILLWVPLISSGCSCKSTDYKQWRNQAQVECLKRLAMVVNKKPYWIMAQFLLDNVLVESIINHKSLFKTAKKFKPLIADNCSFDVALAVLDEKIPVDRTVVFPSFNTSVLNFVEKNYSRNTINPVIEADPSLRVEIRTRVRLMVNSTYLGSSQIKSMALVKQIKNLNFDFISLFDPMRIKETILKYEGYLELLNIHKMDLIDIFTIYVQEGNICFFTAKHSILAGKYSAMSADDVEKRIIASLLLYIENKLAAYPDLYSKSHLEQAFIQRRIKINNLEFSAEERDSLEGEFAKSLELIQKLFPNFESSIKKQAEQLTIDILIHVHSNTQVNNDYCKRLLDRFGSKIESCRNSIKNADYLTDYEKKHAIMVLNLLYERYCFRVSTEIINLNNKAVESMDMINELNNQFKNKGEVIRLS